MKENEDKITIPIIRKKQYQCFLVAMCKGRRRTWSKNSEDRKLIPVNIICVEYKRKIENKIKR